MNLIEQLGGYDCAKAEYEDPMYEDNELYTIKATGARFFKHNLADELLEHRRQHNIFEIKDIVFIKDQHYSEMWFITNILPDGSIELKTAAHGYPVPNRCWGMYYGKAEGLQHATDDEIHSGQRKAPI